MLNSDEAEKLRKEMKIIREENCNLSRFDGQKINVKIRERRKWNE